MNGMSPTTALLFPGQGSHFEGMHEAFADHPLLRRGIELLGFDPFDSLAEGTRSHQPALSLERDAVDPPGAVLKGLVRRMLRAAA
jgi:malonyl CoA-acyl carrier protein transacylase